VLGVSELLLHQVLGSCDEVIKHILLLSLGACLVPVLAKLTTSSDVGNA
jgi:hypothetical protein